MALGIDQLPFKMTVKMMIDIARRAINAHSYEELQQIHGQLPVCKCSGDFLSLFALLRAKCTP